MLEWSVYRVYILHQNHAGWDNFYGQEFSFTMFDKVSFDPLDFNLPVENVVSEIFG